MPQGAFKSRKTLSANLPPQKRKTQKSSLKMKKGNMIFAKKTAKTESKKLKDNLQKAINAKIEEEVKTLASNDAMSLRILKCTDKTKKK